MRELENQFKTSDNEKLADNDDKFDSDLQAALQMSMAANDKPSAEALGMTEAEFAQ